MKSAPLLAIIILIHQVLANVEKTIFVAPAPLLLQQDAAIDSLLLMSLSPQNRSIRTFLNASFPAAEKLHGEDTWILLEDLHPGQRYELRVCWLATQPTAFWIDTYTLSEAFETPHLITSLSSYAYARRDDISEAELQSMLRPKHEPRSEETSLLFLRIQAAADYFSLHKMLMEDVPPVHVDLILDPYLMNVFPQSLRPTAVYIGAIAIVAYFLSGVVWRYLMSTLTDPHTQAEARDMKER